MALQERAIPSDDNNNNNNNAGNMILKSNAVPTIFTYSSIKTCSQSVPNSMHRCKNINSISISQYLIVHLMIILFTKDELNMFVPSYQLSSYEKENNFHANFYVNISKESETFDEVSHKLKYSEKRITDLTRHNKVCDKVSNIFFCNSKLIFVS